MPGECLNTESAAHSGAKYTFVAVDIDTTGKRLIDEVRDMNQGESIRKIQF